MAKCKATCAVIANDKGELLLVKRGRDPFKGSWGLVGGVGESKKGLAPEEAIIGEVEWDLGTRSFTGERWLSFPLPDDPHADEMIVFAGTIADDPIRLRPGYSEGYRWVSRDEALALEGLAFESGEILRRYIEERSEA